MARITQQASSMVQSFERAVQNDVWSQRLEAIEDYRKTIQLYEDSLNRMCDSRKDEMKMEAIIDRIRSRVLQLLGTDGGPTVAIDQLKSDLTELQRMVTDFQTHLNSVNGPVIQHISNNLAQPKPSHRMAGFTYVTIHIDRIGLKDARNYVDAYITMRIKDKYGEDLCQEQNTPTATLFQDRYVIFGTNIHLQKAIEELPQDFAIFFEFYHYKTDKKRVSCRCFAIVEKDEIKDGCCSYELYKKPVDYSRKKLYLFTEKPLFLHLEFTLEKHKREKGL